jgi:hypothetical protein
MSRTASLDAHIRSTRHERSALMIQRERFDEGLLDVQGVAARPGVDARHVRRLVHERRIPIKWGHPSRFDPADIDAWLRRATTPERSA